MKLKLEEIKWVGTKANAKGWRKAICPECGKKTFYVSANGGCHCFAGSCGFSGFVSGMGDQQSVAKGQRSAVGGQQSAEKCYKRPEDYKKLPADVVRKLHALGMPGSEPADVAEREVRAYLQRQHISLATALMSRQVYYTSQCFTVERKGAKDAQGNAVRDTYTNCPTLVYVSRVMGHGCNAKMRSVKLLPAPAGEPNGEPRELKAFMQTSPNQPCPPFNIDCLCPALLDPEQGQEIPYVIITEGEKDVLTLLELGYRYAISVPNGASCVPEKELEPFREWLDACERVIICGDNDEAGRPLVDRLISYFGVRSCVVQLVHYKDISEYYQGEGAEAARRLIDAAPRLADEEILYVDEKMREEAYQYLMGNYDHGYDLGFGDITDHYFHLTDVGGLIVVSGNPNAGKTDWLNDMMARLIFKRKRNICMLSYEVPDKPRLAGTFTKLATGEADLSGYDREDLEPFFDILEQRFVQLQPRLHTGSHIISLANRRRKELERRGERLHFLTIDPFLFVDLELKRGETETVGIRNLLTKLQRWGRDHHIWVVMVAHPPMDRPIQMYFAAGSAHWSNLADFLIIFERITEGDYKIMHVMKVRDQDFCKVGKVFYHRLDSHRYVEHATEDEARARVMQGGEEEVWGD